MPRRLTLRSRIALLLAIALPATAATQPRQRRPAPRRAPSRSAVTAPSRGETDKALVPARFRGVYVHHKWLRALGSQDRTIEEAGCVTRISERLISEDCPQESTSETISAFRPGRQVSTLVGDDTGTDNPNRYELRVRRTWAFLGSTLGRLNDSAPALTNFDIGSLPLAALLARGYRTQDGAIFEVENILDWRSSGRRLALLGRVHDLNSTHDRSASFAHGIEAMGAVRGFLSGDVGVLRAGWHEGDKDFMVRQQGAQLLLIEAQLDDGPDPIERPGGVTITLQRLAEPPYVVLADALSVRPRPLWKARPHAKLHLGDRVQVWARSKDKIKRGKLTGSFALVQSGETNGWVYAPFLGRLLDDTGGKTRFGAFDRRLQRAPIFATWTEADEARCGLYPAGERSRLIRVARGPLRPTRVRWSLANLDGDGRLDPICVQDLPKALRVCSFRSKGAGEIGFADAGCVEARLGETGRHKLGLSSKDVNGDGERDLRVSVGKTELFFPYDFASKKFVDAAISAAGDKATPKQGAIRH